MKGKALLTTALVIAGGTVFALTVPSPGSHELKGQGSVVPQRTPIATAVPTPSPTPLPSVTPKATLQLHAASPLPSYSPKVNPATQGPVYTPTPVPVVTKHP